MEKINSDVFKGVVKTMRDKLEPEPLDDERLGNVTSYMMDDIILTFNENNGKKSFMGLSFDALGMSFHIIPSGEVLIEGEDPDETLTINDAAMMKMLEEYLEWRMKVLINIEI